MKANDKTTTIQDLKDLVVTYREERGWGKHHSLKNLAVSITLEAAELLEHFQWGDKQEDKQAIADELADVLIYCYFFADTAGIDISTAFKEKLDAASKKYPPTVFKKDSASLDDYYTIKQQHRNKK